MSVQNIDSVISNAEIEDICRPCTGDCVSVAVAIQNVFGGEYICSYQFPSDITPAHAAVEINSEIYDGTGKISEAVLYDIAISGLSGDRIEDTEKHIGYTKELKNSALYDEKTSNRVQKALEKSK